MHFNDVCLSFMVFYMLFCSFSIVLALMLMKLNWLTDLWGQFCLIFLSWFLSQSSDTSLIKKERIVIIFLCTDFACLYLKKAVMHFLHYFLAPHAGIGNEPEKRIRFYLFEYVSSCFQASLDIHIHFSHLPKPTTAVLGIVM